MADFADIGSEATEAAIADAINKQRLAAKASTLEATGECLNPRCGDDTEEDEDGNLRLFCSVKCRNEYDALQRRKQ